MIDVVSLAVKGGVTGASSTATTRSASSTATSTTPAAALSASEPCGTPDTLNLYNIKHLEPNRKP